MTQAEPKTSHQSNPGFTLGLIFGVIVGFILAIFIYKKNKKTFDLIAQRFDQLIKDFLLPQTPPPSPSSKISRPRPVPSSVKKSTPRPRRRSRPRTFHRGKK